MSRDQSWNQHSGRSTGNRNLLGIILLILIGLIFFSLAYQVITERGRSHAAKFGLIKTSGEKAKLLYNTR